MSLLHFSVQTFTLIPDSIHYIIFNTQSLKLRVSLRHPHREHSYILQLIFFYLEFNSKPQSIVLRRLYVVVVFDAAAAAVYIPAEPKFCLLLARQPRSGPGPPHLRGF